MSLPLETDTGAYPPEGRLANALADHFGKGFDANFVDTIHDDFSDELRDDRSASFAPDYANDFEDEFDDFNEAFDRDDGNVGGAFNRRLARQFTGEDDPGSDGYDFDDEDSLPSRPLGLRSLQWIRRNMTSLRIIVSLQRVTPPDIDHKPRKASGI